MEQNLALFCRNHQTQIFNVFNVLVQELQASRDEASGEFFGRSLVRFRHQVVSSAAMMEGEVGVTDRD